MQTSLFDYDLPKHLIAQHPPDVRGTSRLMIIDTSTGQIRHKRYLDLVRLCKEGDVIVINETKVCKARVYATVIRTGCTVELVFLREERRVDCFQVWSVLIGRAHRVKDGDSLVVGNHMIAYLGRNTDCVSFLVSVADAHVLMDEHGHVPLPPYIKRESNESDECRYNTVFAKNLDSAAAPTASINLTDDMLCQINRKGVCVAKVNLAVGLGTFASVDTQRVQDYSIHAEEVTVPEETVQIIRKSKGRVWAFGTTVVRALESATVAQGTLETYSGKTDLFIYPPYSFKIVDVLVTNFHQPRTSLLMLVAAFIGRDRMFVAYEEAKNQGYAFLSYGDSMVAGDFSDDLLFK